MDVSLLVVITFYYYFSNSTFNLFVTILIDGDSLPIIQVILKNHEVWHEHADFSVKQISDSLEAQVMNDKKHRI